MVSAASRPTTDYIEGAPELIGEISASSASRDLHVKLRMYERVGVKEYLVWKTLEQEFVFHRAQRGKLRPVAQDSDGIFRSQVFPGLWLDPAALIAGDMRRVFDVLREGIASPEHSKFVEQLAAKRAK